MISLRRFLEELQLVQGLNANGCGAIQLVNAARRSLYEMGDWDGTIDYCAINLSDCFFYLPYHVELIRDAWVCNRPLNLEKESWLSLEQSQWNGIVGPCISVVKTGKTNVLQGEARKGKQLGFRIIDGRDKGKKLSVSIYDESGSLTTEEIVFEDNKETIAAPAVLGKLDSIAKERTIGSVGVYEIQKRRKINLIQYIRPQELEPRYHEYKSFEPCNQIIIKGKKKFFDYDETDLDRTIDIRSIDGLRSAVIAIKQHGAGNIKDYVAMLQSARAHVEAAKNDVRNINKATTPAQYIPELIVSSQEYTTHN